MSRSLRNLPLLVFDLDGTLVDSRRDLADAANLLIEERGGAVLTVETVTSMVGEGAATLVRRALTAAGVQPDVERDLARFLLLYDQCLLANTTLYPGIGGALEALGERATLAVLTNKPQRPSEEILIGLGIRHLFEWVIGGDTSLGRKPDPAGLREIMRRANTSPAETTMIGDSAIDLRTASAAGTRRCVVRYGFGFRSAEADLTGDEILADNADDLVRLLRS